MPKPPVRLLVLIHAVFLLTGVVATMLGPLLPELSEKWGLSDSQAGGLFALQSTGLFSDSSGSLRSAMILLLACAAAMIVLQIWLIGQIQAARRRRDSMPG